MLIVHLHVFNYSAIGCLLPIRQCISCSSPCSLKAFWRKGRRDTKADGEREGSTATRKASYRNFLVCRGFTSTRMSLQNAFDVLDQLSLISYSNVYYHRFLQEETEILLFHGCTAAQRFYCTFAQRENPLAKYGTSFTNMLCSGRWIFLERP